MNFRHLFVAITLFTLVLLAPKTYAAQFINQQGKGDGITIAQPTDDTLFIIGNNVNISSRIDGDVFVIGQSSVKITGTIAENLFVTANNVQIDGTIEGDVFIFAGTLMLDDNAVVGKNVYAYSPQLITKPSATVKGKVVTPDKTDEPLGERLTNHLLATLALLATGFMVVYFFPKTLKRSVEISTSEWGGTLLWGVIGLILVPVIAGILIVTRIGLPIGLIILSLYLIDLYLSTVIIGATLGRLITHSRLQLTWSMVVGILFIQLLRFAPGLNGVISFAVVIWGLGAILLTKKFVVHHFRHDF